MGITPTEGLAWVTPNVRADKHRAKSIWRAYTLTEMVIVLAVIAALMALAWPAVSRPSSRSQLIYAAKTLRAELAQARLEAIRANRPWQFCYEPGGQKYFFAPLGDGSTVLGGGSNSPGVFEEQAATGGVLPSEVSAGFGGELPGEIRFATDGFDASSGDTQRREVTSGTMDAPGLSAGEAEKESSPELETTVLQPLTGGSLSAGWVRILFLPSGRCPRNYLVKLESQDGSFLPIVIRAVTGTAMIGEPTGRPNLPLKIPPEVQAQPIPTAVGP